MHIVEELIDRLNSHKAGNAAYLAAVQRGEFSNAWVDQLLGSHDCPIDVMNTDAPTGT